MKLALKNAFCRNDKVIIDPGTGYAKLETVLFAAGDLIYTADDVGEADAGVHTVTPEELQKPEFLNALKALDIVIRHQDVDSDNYGDEVIPDGQIADPWWDEDTQAVKGVIVIKDKDAIQKVVDRELWGGSLAYKSEVIHKNGGIFQENLIPQHWALTNNPRDDRVQLNNEKFSEGKSMPKSEEKKTEEKKPEEEKKSVENADELNMHETITNMASEIKNMGTTVSALMESMAAMKPIKNDDEEAEEVAAVEASPISDGVLDILVDSYAVKNGISVEDLKNEIEGCGMDGAIGSYEKAMKHVANMAAKSEEDLENADKDKEKEDLENADKDKDDKEDKDLENAADADADGEEDIDKDLKNEKEVKSFLEVVAN